MKEPSYRELSHGGLIFSCSKIQRTTRASETAACYRRPGNESEIVLLAVVKNIFVFAICEVIPVLNAYYWNNVSSVFDFPDRNFRKTNMSNLALALQFLEAAQRFLDRNFRIDPMQLVEIDTLQPQAAKAHLYPFLDVLSPSDRLPPIGTLPGQTALRCDNQAGWVRVQGLRDQSFADLRAVRIGRIDKVDAKFDRSTQDTARLLGILRFAPDALSG